MESESRLGLGQSTEPKGGIRGPAGDIKIADMTLPELYQTINYLSDRIQQLDLRCQDYLSDPILTGRMPR